MIFLAYLSDLFLNFALRTKGLAAKSVSAIHSIHEHAERRPFVAADGAV